MLVVVVNCDDEVEIDVLVKIAPGGLFDLLVSLLDVVADKDDEGINSVIATSGFRHSFMYKL